MALWCHRDCYRKYIYMVKLFLQKGFQGTR
jgi:hypothetical protein